MVASTINPGLGQVSSLNKNYAVPVDDGTSTKYALMTQIAALFGVSPIRLKISTADTTDSDPGNGLLKFNNATQASATVLYIDDVDVNSVSLAAYWADLSAGYLYIVCEDNSAKWAIYKFSAVANGTGYRKFTGAFLVSGTAFASTDPIRIAVGAGGGGAGGGGLTNFTDTVNTASPNGTVPVSTLSAVNAATNVDIALVAKGNGALMSQIPDATSTKGNKRGSFSIDFQRDRSDATQVASGYGSYVWGGSNNKATGSYSSVLAGYYQTVTGFAGAVLWGYNNTSTGYEAVAGGESCLADGDNSIAFGMYASTKGLGKSFAMSSGVFSTLGQAQTREAWFGLTTSNSTPDVLAGSPGGGASVDSQLVLDNNSSYLVSGTVIARETSTGDTKAFSFTTLVKRGANASTVAVVGTPTVTTLFNDTGAAAWTIAIGVNTTLGSMKITATGANSKTINWFANFKSVERVS